MATSEASVVSATADQFRVGRVLGNSLNVLLGHFAKFFLAGLITVVPFGTMGVLIGLRAAPFTIFGARYSSIRPLLIATTALLAVSFYALGQAVTLYGALQDMRDRPFRLREALLRAFVRFFPLIGLAISVTVVVVLGMFLLIVPGLMLALSFYVSLSTCVVESLGPLQSMSRSAALTKGHRWQLFGMVTAISLTALSIGFVVRIIFVALGGPMIGFGVYTIWNAVTAAYSSIVVSVTYYHLRVAKEGIDIDRIAAVFD